MTGAELYSPDVTRVQDKCPASQSSCSNPALSPSFVAAFACSMLTMYALHLSVCGSSLPAKNTITTPEPRDHYRHSISLSASGWYLLSQSISLGYGCVPVFVSLPLLSALSFCARFSHRFASLRRVSWGRRRDSYSAEKAMEGHRCALRHTRRCLSPRVADARGTARVYSPQCDVWPGGHTLVEGTRREQPLGRVESPASRWCIVQSRILDAILTCTEDSSSRESDRSAKRSVLQVYIHMPRDGIQ